MQHHANRRKTPVTMLAAAITLALSSPLAAHAQQAEADAVPQATATDLDAVPCKGPPASGGGGFRHRPLQGNRWHRGPRGPKTAWRGYGRARAKRRPDLDDPGPALRAGTRTSARRAQA